MVTFTITDITDNVITLDININGADYTQILNGAPTAQDGGIPLYDKAACLTALASYVKDYEAQLAAPPAPDPIAVATLVNVPQTVS